MSSLGLPAQPGLVAVGDSITNGRGAPVMGVPCRSWAQWLADVLGLPFHGLAEDGAVAADVVDRQLPRVRFAYGVGVVYAGVNDVRHVDFDAQAFADSLATIAGHVGAHADVLLLCTIPLDLGRPRAGAAKVTDANAVITAVAAEHEAAVVDLTDLTGWRLVLPDAVHPTALGQLEIADRAARALALETLPSALARRDDGRRATARYALTSHLPAVGRDRRRRVAEAAGRRLGR
ncbi:hypothetical protein DSM112329_01831 [Paraconexibacter sp. AEG42_29]|uniref:SGNH hydrolase-type esterase domain-containing protein n=1 Tax=Paraconexibacter sp. AEG42_29 TaxID=2997339 RepID=A0AAU7ATK6_9ACTN